MSGCLDNVHCDCGIDLTEKRNGIAAVSSGFLFFVGWWVIIGIAAQPDTKANFNDAFYACGCVGTIAMFMINAVSNSQVRGDAMTDGLLGTRGARVWLLIGFVLGFGALIASIWILFQEFVVATGPYHSRVDLGIALFMQNFLIFISALVYKFGRTEDLWG